jgi:KUP system potassium uptake protein
MISGMFSVVYQAMTTRTIPLLKVDYTSSDLRSQIYIGTVNWFLLASVLLVMLVFRESSRLAAAYGLAVTGTMTITGVMMTLIFLKRRRVRLSLLALAITCVDLAFLASCLFKLPHGGYWSLVIAAIPLGLILIYMKGQRALYRALKPIDLDVFLEHYFTLQREIVPIHGTALFFARDMIRVPPYLFQTMCVNHIMYTDNIVISITRTEEPFGVSGFFRECYAEGLRQFEILQGYMEVVDVGRLLTEAGIDARAIFYGIEDIATRNIFWQIFSVIKRLAPSYVQFYKLPQDRLHGVVTRVVM